MVTIMFGFFQERRKKKYAIREKLRRIEKSCGGCCPDAGDEKAEGVLPGEQSGSKDADKQSKTKVPSVGVKLPGKAYSISHITMGEVCLMTESPFRILKVAAVGNAKEFERLYNADNSRLGIRDSKGFAPIHHAASKGRNNILEMIVKYGGDLNAKDNCGNTALHVCVDNARADSVDCLIRHGARTDILNQRNLSPLHLAVTMGKPAMLEALLNHTERVDANLRGELGVTALHHAALLDKADCGKKLLEFGANMCLKCDIGYYPVHTAATNGSAKMLETLLSHGKKQGRDILEFKDKDNNVPLHAAVNSGNEQVVRLCLQAGANILAAQHDKSTPVHLACSQGLLGMVKLMFQLQEDMKYDAMCAVDAMKMTPIHTAALFDHTAIVQFLIDEGCDVNGKDKEERTPLLIASSRMGWRTVSVLLQSEADVTIKDRNRRNFLHVAVLNGARINELGVNIMKGMKDLLNETDESGCTALHYASREGHLHALDGLIKLGALLDIKNNDKQSPLHFAAKYGRIHSCRRLLDSPEGAHIINEADGEGLTSLHVASEAGKAKVVRLLLQRGSLLHRDYHGNTPLHLAAMNGFTQSMTMLLSVHAHILDAVNNDGDTALHLAARTGHSRAVTLLLSMKADFLLSHTGRHFFDDAIVNGHKDVAMAVIAHERWREALEINASKSNRNPMLLLIEHLPEVCLAVLDRCKTTNTFDNGEKITYSYHYDFQYLQSPLWWVAERKKNNEEYTPMIALNTMVNFNRVDCLSHPVCVHFLETKWSAYGRWFHWANIIIYMIFLLLLTLFVATNNPLHHTDMELNAQGVYTITNSTLKYRTRQLPLYQNIVVYGIAVFCILSILKEMLQMIQQRMKYLGDFTNLLEWVLYVTTGAFVTPAIFQLSTHWQWECGAVAVFLAWFNLLLYFQRFDLFGIYVVMFLGILKTLLQVLLVFSILIIAFGLSFYILLSGGPHGAHSTPHLSLVRVVIMMLGEIDYIATFMEQYQGGLQSLHFPVISYILLIIFILLMPILLMNLLIGLAVGDIDVVQKNAKLKRLAMQVELHTDLEKKLPQKILEYVDKTESVVNPSEAKGILAKIWSKFKGSGGGADDDQFGFGLSDGETWQEHHIIQELTKQKQRLKDMSSSLERQHELLKLVVEKMEIHSEAFEKDEGSTHVTGSSFRKSGKWNSEKVRLAIPKANAVSAFNKKK